MDKLMDKVKKKRGTLMNKNVFKKDIQSTDF